MPSGSADALASKLHCTAVQAGVNAAVGAWLGAVTLIDLVTLARAPLSSVTVSVTA